jgi:serine/threonine protein kinase
MAKMMTIGQTVKGRYEIEDLIIEGGQASLARGVDRQTGQPVVIKQLRAEPGQSNYTEELARFQRAGQTRIGHPAVVDPLEMVEEDNEWYIIFPFIDGPHLEAYVASRGGKLSVKQAVAITRQVAEALVAIHAQKIIHRDLKPANLLIDEDDHCHIIDLGICKNLRENTITQGDGLLGSLFWMTPEQIAQSGNEDYRTDLYALGAIMYFMLTGSTPAQGHEPGAIAISICRHIPPSPREIDSTIPEYMDQICMKLLAKSPNARFQSETELLQALDDKDNYSPPGGFCISCGNAISSDMRFCQHCGASLETDRSPAIHCLACGASVDHEKHCPGCKRPFGSTDHHLAFTAGALTGTFYRIPEGIFEVGRDELSPREYHISHRHFRVACLNGSVHIQDAGSTNKTYVAGRPAELPIPLESGLELCIAGNTAIYQV